MHKAKKFDTVKMMREIRTALAKRYSRNPELQKKDLEVIRKKYNFDKSENSSEKAE